MAPQSVADSKISFPQVDKFLFENTGAVPIIVGRVAVEGVEPTTAPLELAANSTVGKSASQLGDASEMFLSIQNKTLIDGNITVTHLTPA